MSVYTVYWPELNVFKVGTSERKRWRAFLNRGAILLDLKEMPEGVSDYHYEGACHDALWPICRFAFDTAADAAPYLGGSGGGYVECLRVPGDVMPWEIMDFIHDRVRSFYA